MFMGSSPPAALKHVFNYSLDGLTKWQSNSFDLPLDTEEQKCLTGTFGKSFPAVS